MRWVIEGADATTGRDVRVEVEAADRRHAELEAKKRRILVSTLTAAGPDPSDPMPPVAVAQSMPSRDQLLADLPLAEPRQGAVPGYRDILAGAATVRTIAVIVAVIGWVGAIVYGLATIIFIAVAGPRDALPYLLVGGSAAVVHLVACLAISSLWQLGAGLSIAVRDIARNSFRR